MGETGIGKSALLDEIHRRLTEDEEIQGTGSLGYYSKAESLIALSQFLIYPFVIVLDRLVKEAKESRLVKRRKHDKQNQKRLLLDLERKI